MCVTIQDPMFRINSGIFKIEFSHSPLSVLPPHFSADRLKTVQQFISRLPEAHQHCLKHVMKHLDFVWSHQLKLRDHLWSDDTTLPASFNSASASRAPHMCKPINWLLVFRQILIRPPWSMLTDLATALDVHLQALQTVFFALATSANHESNVPVRFEPIILHPPVPGRLLANEDKPAGFLRSSG